ncbi:MAG TPA: tetratricopeptide repeat protein [Kofleriaceae bacterium]
MARGLATWALVFGFGALAACKDREESRPAPTPPPPRVETDPLATLGLDDKPLDWSRTIAKPTRDLSGYGGTASCKRCHEQIYASYARHSMARTGMRPIGTVDQTWLRKIFDAATVVKHERSGFSYRPFRRGAPGQTKFFVEEALLDASGGAIAKWEEPITHVFSAGSYGLAFYSRRGTQLIHVPIDYYAKAARWDLDPMAFAGNPRFTNALGPFCASCHTDDPAQRFADPLPQGVGCERCHGPSKRHIETLAVTDTVNSAKLSARRQLDVCTQCHQSTNPILRDSKDHFGFVPGAVLDAFRVNFMAEPPEPDRMKLLAHSERLVRSACWQQASDKLTCTTCHDPHVSSIEKTDAWWDGKCLGCHTKTSCTDTKEHRDAAGDHCWTCHMRAGTTGDVPLVTITDHWIQTRPPPIKPGAIEKPKRLVAWSTHIGEPVKDDEMLALSALGHADAGLNDAAVEQAVAAVAKRPSAALYALIANAYLAKRRTQEGGRAFKAALRLDPDHTGALLGYARVMLDAGAFEEAKRALERLLAIDPEHVAALETRGIFLYRNGDRAAALELFKRAVATSRATGASYVALAIDARGNSKQQLEWLELAWRAEPRDRFVLDELKLAAEASGNRARIADVERRRAALDKLSPPPGPTAASAWLPR